MYPPTYWITLESPVGELLVLGDGEALSGLYLDGQRDFSAPGPGWVRDDERLAPVAAQLREYFEGSRRGFELPLAPTRGSVFQRRVWGELEQIPYGETRTYGELASRLGLPNAARAVGHANGRNPISIVVPCHRVVGSTGALTGYGGGLERKRWLLEFEAAGRSRAGVGNEARPPGFEPGTSRFVAERSIR